jgi:hypothetical protein
VGRGLNALLAASVVACVCACLPHPAAARPLLVAKSWANLENLDRAGSHRGHSSASDLARQKKLRRQRPNYPAWWVKQARCIHRYEVGLGSLTDLAAWPLRWDLDTGNTFYGGFQFMASTWRSMGGRGLPSRATRREQIYRAYLNWKANGRRWGGQQWPTTARLCGLK